MDKDDDDSRKIPKVVEMLNLIEIFWLRQEDDFL